ncbi:MAG: inositol monophosphatase [Anaerolineae bacterium]|nr:inositol monophosphatase [Anaerolineae bacterium]
MSEPTLETIIAWARHAGDILRQGFGQQHQVNYKSEIDLVTEMDHRSEGYLLSQVHAQFPGDTITSEESGVQNGQNGHCWYIDPLDGTVNYAHGVPIFAVSIAYGECNQMQLGVIYDPMRDECFSARRGQGAWLNGQPIRVARASDLNRALLVTGFPYNIRERQETNLRNYEYFSLHSQGVRRLGSAALDLSYIACGRFDGYWELELMPWDLAAGALIATEAGALVTPMHESQRHLLAPPCSIIAANPAIHAQLAAPLRMNRIT